MKKILRLGVCFVLVACGNGTNKETENKNTITIAVVPKLIGIPYFNASERGAIQAGKDLGIKVIYTGPATADAAEQVRMIDDLLVQGIDVLAVAPNDPASITPVLKRARAQGVIVLDWDTPADPDSVDYSVQQIDNANLGTTLVEELIKSMGTDTGEIGIITGGLSAANLNSWIAASKNALKQYPNINIVSDPVPTDEQMNLAYQRTLEMLQAYPNLKGILAYSTVAPIGAAQAIQERKLQDRISLVGTALPTDSVPFLNDSSIKSAVLWDPTKLGYLTVIIGQKLVKGDPISDGMEIANVGKISVNGKVIVMGPPTVFTKDNARDFDF
ncbi:MAG: autoinducer 2 ABC transporter substrate-binding protein [Brevinema sp.]